MTDMVALPTEMSRALTVAKGGDKGSGKMGGVYS
jgi:hypothetical protein